MYAAPDWNAFNGVASTPIAPQMQPLDPLSAAPSSGTAGPGSNGFEHFAYPPLPNSSPPSECGDADEYGDHSSSFISHSPVHPPAFPIHHNQPQMQLSLNMQYIPPSSAPGSAASYDYSHVHALDYAQQHQYSPAASSATSPMTGSISVSDQMSRFSLDMMGPPAGSPVRTAASPVVYHSQGMMAPPGHHIQQSPHLQHHLVPHPHSQPIPHSHHMHSHSQSMESFHDPLIQSGGEPQQQWGEWTHPDPFRQGQVEALGEAHNVGGSGSFDPLATGNSAIVDAYRG
jgi:hypothetical protein